MYLYNAGPTIKNTTIINSSKYDLYFNGNADGTITGNTINNGIYALQGRFDSFGSNTINYNNSFPLKLHPENIERLAQCTFNGIDENSKIEVTAGYIRRDTVWPNIMPLQIAGSIDIQGSDGADGVTSLTIEPGVEVRFKPGQFLQVAGDSTSYKGALIAQGTPENKIIFTSSSATPSPGDWNGISFRAASSDTMTILEHCEVSYAGGQYGSVYLYNASPIIQYNTIQKNSNSGVYVTGTGSNNAVINCNVIQNNPNGIYLSGATPTISGNNFFQTANYAVYNASGSSVIAENNWWNDVNGPGFNGEEVFGNLDVTPWLIVESDCINNNPTNKPPFAPSSPTPAHGAVKVQMTDQALTLGWVGQDPNVWDTLTYDVYLGTESDNIALVAENLTEAQFEVAALLYGTTYFWQVVAKDAVGQSTTGSLWQFTTAGLPPDLVVNAIAWNPVKDLAAGQSVLFTGTIKNMGTGPCVDPFQVLFRVDGNTIGTLAVDQILAVDEVMNLSMAWTAVTGDHTVEVEADSGKIVLEVNEDNNILSQSITGIKDPEPPALVGTIPAGNSFSQQVDQITVTFADEHGQVDDAAVISSMVVRDQNTQVVAGTINENNDVFTFIPSVVPLAAGVYTVSLVAKDVWGNTQAYNFSFTVDKLAPAIPAITGGTVTTGIIKTRPEINKSIVSGIQLTGTREADTKVWINGLEKTGFGAGDWSVDLVLIQGGNAIEIILEDQAGNRSASVFVDIILDSLAPVITDVKPHDNTFFNNPPLIISVGYTEQTSGLDMTASILSVKDMNLSPIPGVWADSGGELLIFTPAAPFAESIFQVEIQLQDTLGNQGIAQMTHFTVDLTKPPVPVIDSVTTPTHSNTQTIIGIKEAYAAVWMDEAEVEGHTDQTGWEHQVTLASGQNIFVFKAMDRAGNESDPVSIEIFFDDTPPLPVDNLIINPDGNGRSVILNWIGYDESIHGDIAAYRIYAQLSTFSSVAGLTPYATIEAGNFETTVENLTRNTPYFFAVVAVDDAGNALETVTPVTATPNDTLAPENATGLYVQCFENKLVLNWQHSTDTDGDLLKYKVYVNGEPEGLDLVASENRFEKTGLTLATAYDFKITSIDADENESLGATFQGITLLANPANTVVTPYSGYVSLSWEMSVPSQYVKQYQIYVSDTVFTNVDGMTPRRTATGLSANISGLTNDTLYYFAVTALNLSGGEQTLVTAVSGTPTNDTTGPALTDIRFENTPLTDGLNITGPGKVYVAMTDPAGVSAVEFHFNGAMVRKDYSDPYSAYIDVFTIPDGSYTLIVTGFDTLGNFSSYEYTLVSGLDTPLAPVITIPENNFITNKTQMAIQGTTDKYTDVTLIHDGVQTDATVVVGPLGLFKIPFVLNKGENRIKAVAENRAGQSPESIEILITVDTSLPDSPRSLTGEPRPDGEIKLLWQKPLNKVVEGFNLFRLETDFTDKDQAVKVNTDLIRTPGYTDLPPGEGSWSYRVLAVDSAGNESGLSNIASAVSDTTAPIADSIEFASRGLVDPVSERYAPARVDVILNLSEPLGTLPFLTITPGGGIPRSVELEKVSDLIYSGFFDIIETMPEGTAYAVFSARDEAGNRGTQIVSGDRLLLDTKGPRVKRLDISPSSPVKNNFDTPVEIQLSFGLSEKIKPGEEPQILLDIANGRQVVDVAGLSETPPQTGEIQAWQANVTLPDDAGLLGPETIEILYTGMDDLDNVSSDILVDHQFQVYQGGLPPLAPPASLTGKAVSKGRIELTWTVVENAVGYQVFRQAPGEGDLTLIDSIEIDSIGTFAAYTDTTTIDGTHVYAVTTIRRENQEESISGLSNTASVDSDSLAPNAPVNLVLDMVAQGVRAQWEAPAFTESVTYSVYRSDQTQISSVAGLTPLVTGIAQLMIVDPTPSPTQHCYVITAVDDTYNESLPSNSYYLNFDLLPVSVIQVSQKDYDPPLITWSHPDKTGKIAGYYAYIGRDRSGFKVNDAIMTDESFTDYGYAGRERSYTIITVDTNTVESMGRFVTLPAVSAHLADQSLIKRGIMNRLDYTVKNESASTVTQIILKVLVGGHLHQSEIFSLDAGESKRIPVILGGYSELNDVETLTTTIEITANPGEQAKIIRTREIEVKDSIMVLQILNEEFIRGGVGPVRFTLENSGAADVEIVTAENSSKNPSLDIRYYLVDEDENVLYSKSFQQSLGEDIIMLPNKKSVARITKGSIFTSEPMDLFIPANAPDTVYVRLEIDNIFYHLGQPDEVKMDGTQTRQEISLEDTSYDGHLVSILPEVSKGDKEIIITGRAIDRATGETLVDAPLNLIISVNGFERKFNINTDETGTFTYVFEPLENEAGVYHVHVVHPDLLDRPDQGTFIINQVSIAPSKIKLSIPKNYEQKISINISTENGTRLTNLRLELATPLQPGVHVDLGDPIPIVDPDRRVTINLIVWADNLAHEFGSLELSVKSDESVTPWGSVLIDTQFSESHPALYFTPDHIETGVAHDDMITETITLENKGLADMGDVSIELKDETGSPAPSWVRLNTPSDIGTLGIGESRKVSISFLPNEGIAQGMHVFYLTVTSSNYPITDIGLYPTVSQSGSGHVLFKLSDIYTGTFNAKNELIRGLANAKIKLQNEATLTNHTLTSDSHGEALFEDLATGSYKCRITANNHQEITCRVWIKPGITVSRDLFLEYNLVTVEWEVNEITIQDKYEILLTATFETDVPAAVVVAEPLSITLPDMVKGDVFHGEFILINHGLIRAEEINIPIPASDENFQYEILTGLPDYLEAKQRITIPYRITCLKSLDREEETGSGGGCYTYSKCIPVSYAYACASGDRSTGTTRHCFYTSGGTCVGTGSPGTGTGGSSSYVTGGGTGGGGGTSSAPSYTPMSWGEQTCLPKPERQESLFDMAMDKLMDKSRHIMQEVGCSVNTALREYNDEATDLVVKVPGGSISIARTYRSGAWQWENLSRITDGRLDDQKTYVLSEYGPDYITKDGVAYKKSSAGIYKQGTNTIERKTDCEQYLGTPQWGQCILGSQDDYYEDKYVFKDKHGNFRQYDSNGRLISYGNRLGAIGSIIYDSPEDKTPSGVADKTCNQVLWFEYDTDNNLARIYDHDARQILYDYTGSNLTKVTDVLGKKTTYEYNDKNNIIQTVDAAGRQTLVSYSSASAPIAVTDSSGIGYFFEYDYDKNKKEYYARIKTSSGRIKEVWYNDKGETKRVDINGRTIEKINQDGRDYIIVDEKRNQTRKEYDEQENLKKIIYPDGTQVAFEYDLRFNKVKQVTDPLERVTTFEYDASGNLTQKTEAKNTSVERVTSFTYNEIGQILTATRHADQNTEETVTEFTYDAQGNLETIIDPLNQTTRFLKYNNSGNLLKMQDARGGIEHEWRFAYDAMGRMTSQTNPAGDTTSFEYDGANNRTAVINALLKRFEFEYDDHNNLIKAIDPLTFYTTTQYNTDHLPVLATDQEGRQAQVQYDNEGRVLKAMDPAGNTVSYAYSEDSSSFAPSNLPVTVTYPTFTRHLTHDRMMRVIEEKDVLDTTTLTRTRTFDPAGNIATSTDEAGRTTTYEYDALNRLIKTLTPETGQIIRTYDNRDNQIMLQDPNQGIQYFTYDKNNRLLTSAKPMGALTRYEYDAVGNKTAVIDAKNQRIEYAYSSENRITQVRYFATGNLATPVKIVDFTQDALGNLLTWSDGIAFAAYTYDDLSRKLSETVDYGTFSLTHAYTYTPTGAQKTFVGPDGNTIVYDYDQGSRLAGITLPGAGQAGISYNPASWNSPTSMSLPGGTRQEFAHDALMRLKTITAKDPGQNPVMTRQYSYDTSSNITQKATEHGDYTYAYDELNRLTTALNPTLPDESYTYDKLGNRITDVKVQGQISYNADNELESYGSTGYDYDANGNMTRKTQGTDVTAFFYNQEDRLVKVEDGSGNVTATYGYDPFGRRLWKEVDGTKTFFHYANEGLVGEYNATGAEIKTYGYKPGSQWTTDPLFMKVGSEYYWYQNDHNGTPQKLIATNGLVVWDGKYDAFGNCQIEIEGITNNLRFAGQYYDAETGLHYNLNRYYDPQLGRYLRADPFGDGLNLYAYCFNDPNGLIDPLGLCAVNNYLIQPTLYWLYALNDLAANILAFPDRILDLITPTTADSRMAWAASFPGVGEDILLGGIGMLGKMPRLATKSRLPAIIPEAINAPIQFTNKGDVFVRYATRADDFKITSGNGISPGTFATTANDTANIRAGFDATKRYALPSDKPAIYPFEIRPPAGTPVQIGRVAPAYGKSGGGAEVIFPYGVSNGSVTSLPPVPRR